jgi:hypothetical protein
MSSYLWVTFFIFVGSIALGAFFYEHWLGKLIVARKRVASSHTLRRKPLANRDELLVWRWLEEVFPEHHIMVKVPFTSFIEPDNSGGDAHWRALLSSVSFACAVSDRKGSVLGCIDVLGRGELMDRKHAFKRELLARAGLPYWIIENERRPEPKLLREKFLGSENAQAAQRRMAQEKEARQRLQPPKPLPIAMLEQRRLSRLANNASELTRAGITTGKLKSKLKVARLAKALMQRAMPARNPPVYRQTSSSLS